MNHPSWLAEAKSHWDAERGYDAGVLICKHINLQQQPLWAANVLRFMIQRAGMYHPIVERAEQLAKDPSKWKQGHDIFSEVRKVTLVHDEQSKETSADNILAWILSVAEQTAKVSYNATSPPDEFDEDSAAWIIACLRGFASTMNDGRILDEAWQIAYGSVLSK